VTAAKDACGVRAILPCPEDGACRAPGQTFPVVVSGLFSCGLAGNPLALGFELYGFGTYNRPFCACKAMAVLARNWTRQTMDRGDRETSG
jgi:hypothetical protein